MFELLSLATLALALFLGYVTIPSAHQSASAGSVSTASEEEGTWVATQP
jgi:hypothetical protein